MSSMIRFIVLVYFSKDFYIDVRYVQWKLKCLSLKSTI